MQSLSKEGKRAVCGLIIAVLLFGPISPFVLIYLWWFFSRPDHPFYADD